MRIAVLDDGNESIGKRQHPAKRSEAKRKRKRTDEILQGSYNYCWIWRPQLLHEMSTGKAAKAERESIVSLRFRTRATTAKIANSTCCQGPRSLLKTRSAGAPTYLVFEGIFSRFFSVFAGFWSREGCNYLLRCFLGIDDHLARYSWPDGEGYVRSK